jgi:large subunit ribosomal protein L18
MSLSKPERRQRIRFRIRKSVVPNQGCLYLEVTKNAQLIDDVNGVTFLLLFPKGKGTNVDVATAVGKLVAEKG